MPGPISRQHFAWPFELAASGQIAMVEQNSDQDISAAMAITLSWPLGSRDMDPEFGIADQAFLDGGPSAQEIKTALAHGEPRALTAITMDDEALERFAGQVRVAWQTTDQLPAQ